MKRIAYVVSLIVPAWAALPFALHWSALPEPMASHWNLSGTPDASLPRVLMLALHVGASSLSGLAALRAIRLRYEHTSNVLGIASFVCLLFSALAFLVVHANFDAPMWQEAQPISLFTVLVIIGFSLGLSALVSRATRSLNCAPNAIVDPPSAGLRSGERALYQRRTKARGISALAVVTLTIAIVALFIGRAEIALISSIVSAVLVPFTQVRVRIDRQRFTVEYGPLAFPTQSFELDRIERANVTHVNPLAHGGWG